MMTEVTSVSECKMVDGKMSDTIPTKAEEHTARQGIYFQLINNTQILDSYPNLTTAIVELGLGEFIENQVQVIASSRAWVRVTELRLNKLNRSEERLNNGG